MPSEKEMLALSLIAMGELRVDDLGRIWRGSRRADTGRAKGYLRLQFTAAGRRFAIGAHRVVWMTANGRFIPDGMEVNHKDGDKANNCPDNLEIVLRPFNVAHGLHRLGNMKRRKTSGAKLTREQVLEIRELCRLRALPKAEIARRYNVTVKTIRMIHNRATWQEVFPESIGA